MVIRRSNKVITNIGTVAIYVNDQRKAKKFWTEKVGFVVVAEQPMGTNSFGWK